MKYGFVLYVSETKGVLPPEEIVKILAVSRMKNARNGITGFLHYNEGCFVQYLEGHLDPLAATVARIAKDRRHSAFRIIAEGDLEARMFSGWDMGVINQMRRSDIDRILDVDADETEVTEEVLDLLVMFSMRSDIATDFKVSAA